LSFLNFDLTTLLARVIVLMTALPVHEAAHAYAAMRMGDDTAYYSNRLTFNPLHHIDPIGAVMILFLGVGFAKPVPVNSMRFRDRKKGIVVTSLAGPLSNIVLAFLAMVVTKLLFAGYLASGAALARGAYRVFSIMVSINIALAVFNLLPIPPLDGYHAVMPFLPAETAWKIQQYERQIVWILLLLVWVGLLNAPLRFFNNLFYSLVDSATFFVDPLMRAAL